MKRIYSIDFFKLLFAYLIAFSHFNINLPGANIAVVFFFIISGYFLGKKFYLKSASTKNSYSGVQYTIDHFKTLYPHYIFSLMLMFSYFIFKNVYYILIDSAFACSISALLQKTYDLLPELFLVQNIGFFNGGMNYPLWQVCALLICGYFIYTLLYYNEKKSTNIIFPAAIILIQTYLKGVTDIFGTAGMFYIPLLRAFSAISFGVLICKFLNSSYYKENILKYKNTMNICSVMALVSVFMGSHNDIFLIIAVFIIAALVDPTSWLNKVFNNKIFRKAGIFSYSIYLNHALVIWIVKDFQPEIFSIFNINETKLSSGLFFFVVLTVYSLITTSVVEYLKQKNLKKSGSMVKNTGR